jgi:hypothetical protein
MKKVRDEIKGNAMGVMCNINMTDEKRIIEF